MAILSQGVVSPLKLNWWWKKNCHNFSITYKLTQIVDKHVPDISGHHANFLNLSHFLSWQMFCLSTSNYSLILILLIPNQKNPQICHFTGQSTDTSKLMWTASDLTLPKHISQFSSKIVALLTKWILSSIESFILHKNTNKSQISI